VALSFDLTHLLEPNLLIPGEKPVGAVTIDWTHPLTEGLWLFNLPLHRGGIDVVSGRALFGGSGISHGVSHEGRYYRSTIYDTDSTSSIATPSPPVAEWSGVTCVSIFRYPWTTLVQEYPGTVISVRPGLYYGNYLLSVDASQPYFQFRGGDSGTASNISFIGRFNQVSEKVIFQCGTWDKTVIRQWVAPQDGVLETVQDVAQTVDFGGATEHDLLYYSRAPGRGFPGEIYVQMIFGRALSAQEVEALYQDPYQFLIPAV